MTNDELFEKINKRFDTLEQGQAQTHTILAQHKTALEAVAAGQQDLRTGQKELQEDVKEIRGTMATKADVQDLRADLGNKFKKLTERVEAVEEIEGIPNPHKH